MKKIVVDPVTRIEGHLRAEVQINDEGIVQEAYVSGQLFRGMELILENRDPRDAGLLAGRICGVCTNSHFKASIQAVENAYAITPPTNAILIRDLMSMALFIQDHVVHFYQLHLLDYVDVLSALKADAKKTSEETHQYCDKPFRNAHTHYETVLQRLKNFVDAGRLGPFGNGYWGHHAYALNSEENLVLLSHYFEALKFQTKISKAIAIFGGKTPHPQTLVVGGITSVADMLNPQRLNDFLFVMKEANDFVNRAYLPDMKLLAKAYKHEMKAGMGRANGNFFAVGGYGIDEKRTLFSSGVIYEHDFSNIHAFESTKITEEVKQAWYSEDEKQVPFYTDLNEDGTLKTEKTDKYSWIKAPRYDGNTMETGPLARVFISYMDDSSSIKPFVDEFLDACDLTLMDLSSSVGRSCARAIETQYVCEYVFKLISKLIQHIKYYDTQTWQKYDFNTLHKACEGSTFLEVPRGVLFHSVKIKKQKIQKYQVIAPTTWNASPKNSDTKRGAYEEALIGIHIADVQKPLEVLKVLHSFDPCLACAVHIVNTQGKTLGRYKLS